MRTRWLVALVGTLAIVVGIVAWLRPGADVRSTPLEPPAAAGAAGSTGSAALPAREVVAGAVVISIEPIRIDQSGAVFRILMDTHSGDLSADLAAGSVLEVDGVEWSNPSWSGDPPGGHHRQGELAFPAAGDAAGSATLTMEGFSAPVDASWSLAG